MAGVERGCIHGILDALGDLGPGFYDVTIPFGCYSALFA